MKVKGLLYLFIALNIFSCSTAHKKDKEEKLVLDSQPGINAPEHYPITTVFASFSNGDKTVFRQRYRVEIKLNYDKSSCFY